MKITYKTFKNNFSPIKNFSSNSKKEVYIDCVLQLNIPEDFECIKKNTSQKKVWTILKGANNLIYAIPGESTHRNPLGFFVTEIPYTQHHFENLRVILQPGYEDIRKSDIEYLKFLKTTILEKSGIPLNENVFDRIINRMSEKFLEVKY